jgi:guanylate kinase
VCGEAACFWKTDARTPPPCRADLTPSSHSPPSPCLQDGVHYHFTTREAFEAAIEAGEFLEHAHVHGNIYGTSTAAVAAVADAGKTCILDIDVQGARAVRRAGVPAVFVFVAPPSLDELESRLRGRGTETEAQIKTRLKNAKDELERYGRERKKGSGIRWVD